MSENHGNPTGSPIIQAMLDAIEIAKETGNSKALESLQAALKVLQRDKRLTHSADAKFNAHRYPNKSITYTKIATYDQCPERFELSHGAQSILSWMASAMSQDGLITVSQSDLSNIVHITNKQQLRRCIDELCRYHFLAVWDKPPKGSHKPVTYVLDRRIMCTGKDPKDADITQFINLTDKTTNGRNNLKPPAYQQEIITRKCPDGKIVRIGTITSTPMDDTEKKEPASALKANTSSLMPKPRINDTMALNKLSTNIIPPPDIDDIIIPDINNTDGM